MGTLKERNMLIKLIILPIVFSRNCFPNYTGRTSTTRTGKRCQRWDTNKPHRTKFRPNPKNNNFCRNPDNDANGPWCYTMDPSKRFEYCNIRACPNQNPLTTKSTTTKGPTPSPPTKDCYPDTPSSYTGRRSTTVNGKICQNWNANSPHRPKHRPGNHNFCRAPDNDQKSTWCYTMDSSKRWEYCDVPKCTETQNDRDPNPNPGTEKCGVPTYNPEDDFDHDMRRPSLVTKTGQISPGSDDDGPEIYGGTDALPQRLPWQVYLNGPFGCGGTLVSLKTVITAMHCIVETTASQWSISAGHIKKGSKAARESGYQRIRVKSQHFHPRYNPSTNDNDIAIMVVERPFKYTNFVRPACLPERNFKIFDGATALISGFGATEHGPTTTLIQNTIPMLSRSDCNRNLYGRVSQHMICGGKVNDDTCQGDSGGPLIAVVDNSQNGEREYTLFGVTSWGYGCGTEGKPGVYAEVADYITFINRYL